MTNQRELLRQIQDLITRVAQAAADAPVLHQRANAAAEVTHADAITAAASAHQQTTASARAVYDRQMQEATAVHDVRVQDAETMYRSVLGQAEQAYEDKRLEILRSVQSVNQAVVGVNQPWDHAYWRSWQPDPAASPPRLIRIGQLLDQGLWGNVVMPAFLPLINGSNVLWKTAGQGNPSAVQAIQSLLLRLLAAIPPAKLRFTFIDPVGLGQNVASFMHLADYDETLIGGKTWTEPQHIEQRLADITEHMEMVIQKYLRNQYRTIEAYNQQAGEVAEPYRLLVVMDFPTNFSEQAARRLVSISQNGPRCGVYTVVMADTQKSLPHNFSLADLERHATVLRWEGQRFVWDDPDFRDCRLELDMPPDTAVFNRIVNAVGAAARDASKVEVPFDRVAPDPKTWQQGDSADGLHAPLGPAGARKLQYLDIGAGTAQHVLVVGKTGSGKSTLLHVLITNLALLYRPDEVALYLIDFKKGVEFKTYAVQQLPHARVIAIESEREFGLSVLQGLDAELKQRGDLFRGAGVDGLADYRQFATAPMPRILLLVDEFQEFFTEDDPIAAQASQILDRLVRQGRAFGIHVLLGTQTLAGAYSLARSTIDQMAIRIALQCSEADSRLILADDNPAARLLSRPGEAIYNAANGMVEGNNLFQVAWLSDVERDRYLARVRTLNADYRPPRPQIVFEGNAPANIANNQLLHDLLVSATWPPPARRVSAWLGDPIAIQDPTAAHIRRQTASNLLIVGQNDAVAMGMFATSLLSLAAQHAPGRAQFYILDFSATDAPSADLLSDLADHLPHSAQRGRRRQLPAIIGDIAGEVNRRLAEEASLTDAPSIFLFIYGLHRARDLRQDDSFGYSYGTDEEKPPTPASQFATILREGPEFGVHTFVWCDTYTNLNRTLDRRALREFEMRVALQMSAEDSSNLVDTPHASKLGPYQALFYSEDEGRLEKFRPYEVPSAIWLQEATKPMQERV